MVQATHPHMTAAVNSFSSPKTTMSKISGREVEEPIGRVWAGLTKVATEPRVGRLLPVSAGVVVLTVVNIMYLAFAGGSQSRQHI